MRRGVAELDSQARSPGGIVVMRSGKNARTVICGREGQAGSFEDQPAGRRGGGGDLRPFKLIDPRRRQPAEKLIEGVHRRGPRLRGVPVPPALSALVAVVTLPVGVLTAFIVMHWPGVSANIPQSGRRGHRIWAPWWTRASKLVEAAHKHVEYFEKEHGRQPGDVPSAGR